MKWESRLVEPDGMRERESVRGSRLSETSCCEGHWCILSVGWSKNTKKRSTLHLKHNQAK